MYETNFYGANFTDATFSGDTELPNTNFSGATLAGTKLAVQDLNCTIFRDTDLTAAIFAEGIQIRTDFFCRVDFSGATFDYSQFPAEDWRYLDMTGATVLDVPEELSTATDPLDLSGAILSEVTWLSGAVLDAANMGCTQFPPPCDPCRVCTQLVNTDLSNASLQQANFKDAVLSGANLNLANLKEADLTGAQLLESGNAAAATLESAYLKNATLDQADLTGVSLSNANFYGSSASAAEATMTDANFSGAYLSGTDFSKAQLEGANFEQAVLVSASFNSANLGTNPVDGKSANFSGAYLQGAVFTNVNDIDIANAKFPRAYLDFNSSGGSLIIQLFPENLYFTGCTSVSACTGCVPVDYNFPTIPPSTTGSGNTCPDENNGPCTAQVACATQNNQTLQRWECPSIPIDQAQPPSPGSCTSSMLDFNW